MGRGGAGHERSGGRQGRRDLDQWRRRLGFRIVGMDRAVGVTGEEAARVSHCGDG